MKQTLQILTIKFELCSYNIHKIAQKQGRFIQNIINLKLRPKRLPKSHMKSNQTNRPELNATPSVIQIPINQNITLGEIQNDLNAIAKSSHSGGLSQNYAIQFELRNISRVVSRIQQKQRRTDKNLTCFNDSNSIFKNGHSNRIDLNEVVHLKFNFCSHAKYNYYGRQYRFQTEKKPLAQQNLQPSNCSSLKQQSKKQDSSATNKQLLNIPNSESYYICFDQPKEHKQQESNSKWILEKKVKNLEREIEALKKQQRPKYFPNCNAKKDSKVSVSKQVNHLITSLWP